MAIVKQSKVIAQLPDVLEPDCLYYVRVGQGFDLYLTDHTGSIAYKQNDSQDILNQKIESIIAINNQQEERLNALSNKGNDVVTSYEGEVMITTRIVEDGFELYLENVENEEIVLTIFSIDGVVSNEEVILSSSTPYKLKYNDITHNDIRTKMNLQWLQTPVIEFGVKSIRYNSNKIRQVVVKTTGGFQKIARDQDPNNTISYSNLNFIDITSKFALYSVKILNNLDVLLNSSNLHLTYTGDSDKTIRINYNAEPYVSKTGVTVNNDIFLITDLESLETELFYPTKSYDLGKYVGKSIKISVIVDNSTVYEYEYSFSPIPIEEALKLRVFGDYILNPAYKGGHIVIFVTDMDNTKVIHTFAENGEPINYYTYNYQINRNYRYGEYDFYRDKNNISMSNYYGFEDFILGKTYSNFGITMNDLNELLSSNTHGIKIYLFGITDIEAVDDVNFNSYNSLYSILETKSKTSVTPKEQYKDFYENTPICIEYSIPDTIIEEDKTIATSTFRRITIKEFFDKFFQSVNVTDTFF